MKTARIVLFLLVCLPAFCAKPKDSDYRDGVLVGFRTVTSGRSCNSYGNVNATTDTNGNTNGNTTSSTNCSDNEHTLYTIKVADNTYVVQRAWTKSDTLKAMSIVSIMSIKSSVLANELPGTPIKVRSELGKFFIKVGKRESQFDVVEAR